MFLNVFDSHVHTDNSWDAEHSLTFICETAIKKGILGLAITDHCEINEYFDRQGDTRIKQGFFEILKARAAFGKGLSLSFGVEMGQILHNIELAKRAQALVQFDFVLGSLHCIDGLDFYFMDYQDVDPYALLEKYYKELYKTAQTNLYDALAHITYPMRYINGRAGLGVDLTKMDDLIDMTLKHLAENGKALEINTAGLRTDFAETSPPARYINRFRELGGEFITIGSDAHMAPDLGEGIHEAMQMAKDAGFSYFTFYKERTPRLVEIY